MPPKARVKAYPIEERHRWVWIWMGDPDRADTSLIPDTHWLDDPAWPAKPGYMMHHSNYLQVADNLCDASHFSFVHATTIGGSVAYAKAMPKIERLDRGVRIVRGLENDEPAPNIRALRPEWDRVDRWNNYDFLVPGILIMDSGSVPTGRGGATGSREDALEFRGCQAITPETDRSTHYFYAQPRNFEIDNDGLSDKVIASLDEAFEEDKRIITGQSRMLAFDPDFKMLPLGIDSGLSQYRWVLNRLIQDEAQQPV